MLILGLVVSLLVILALSSLAKLWISGVIAYIHRNHTEAGAIAPFIEKMEKLEPVILALSTRSKATGSLPEDAQQRLDKLPERVRR
jgi:hypothetical protein